MGLRGPGAHPLKLKPRARRLPWKPPPEPLATPGPLSSAAALRQRRRRERAKNGQIVLQIELPEAEIVELLVAAGCLDVRRDYFSRQDIATGIERFLSLCHA